MQPSIKDIEILHQLIRQAANREILPRFKRIEKNYKHDGSIVTEADERMQASLIGELGARWPDIPVLGEEMSEVQQLALINNNPNGLWILDPLDGTSNFAAGIPCFAISLALMVCGKITLAIIHDPLRDECFSAIEGQGAWLNGEPIQSHNSIPELSKTIALIDFKRLPGDLAATIASAPPYASQRSFGSGVLDWCWLAAGRVHIYLHGKQKLWDYAAGQLILSESGGRATTLDGEAVFRGKLEARSVVAATNQETFLEWQSYLGQSL